MRNKRVKFAAERFEFTMRGHGASIELLGDLLEDGEAAEDLAFGELLEVQKKPTQKKKKQRNFAKGKALDVDVHVLHRFSSKFFGTNEFDEILQHRSELASFL